MIKSRNIKRVIKRYEAAYWLDLEYSELIELEAQGKMPMKVVLSSRIKGWDSDDIRVMIQKWQDKDPPKPANTLHYNKYGITGISTGYPDKLVFPTEMAFRLGISVNTLYLWERRGKVPPRSYITPKKSGWFSDDLNKFIESRKQQRQNQTLA